MTRIAAAIALLLGLAACDPVTNSAMVGASLVSLSYTDKTLGDHVASWATDSDCSLLYATHEEDYCKPYKTAEDLERERADAEAERMAQGHCYRSLGTVTCYREPDPNHSSTAKVN